MPRSRHGVALDLDLDMALAGGSHPAPLASRIADAIIEALRRGALRPGDVLPATRTVAATLGVSRGPVVAAFDELAAAGFVRSRAGSGTVVATGADLAARAGAASHVPDSPPPELPSDSRVPARVRHDLRPGRPDTELINSRAWRRARRHAAAQHPEREADTGPEHREFREALAAHIRRTRGLIAGADDLLIVPGVAATLHALAAVVPGPWAVEDPGFSEARSALGVAGVPAVPITVDEHGLDPQALPGRIRAVYVTPAHQYPLGARMPVARRVALLDWARRGSGWIIEDDYDGEFRYDVAPMPALRSLNGGADRVIYLGTASKLWSPALRVAWVIAPAGVRPDLERALLERGLHVPSIVGHALAALLTNGDWSAHHARSARTYAARRAALVAGLHEAQAAPLLEGTDAGLHLVLRLPDTVDDLEFAARLQNVGVLVKALSTYAVTATNRGLVICYANLPESQAATAAAAIASAIGSITEATLPSPSRPQDTRILGHDNLRAPGPRT